MIFTPKGKWPLIKKLFFWGTAAFVFLIFLAGLASTAVENACKNSIYKNVGQVPEGAEAVMVLGAKVYAGGRMSDMLKDRADTALEIYQAGKAKKILVSGDHGREEYDEVNAVKNYLLDKGVPAEDIFLDHAGFDTYDSMYRARDVFQIRSLIISTQDFHLPRAVYIAKSLGIEAYGISADKHIYGNTAAVQAREILARDKAWLDVALGSKPKFLGSAIPIAGDGRASWDEF